MADNAVMEITGVSCALRDERYVFELAPMNPALTRFLCENADCTNALAQAKGNAPLSVPRGILEALPHAYVFLSDGKSISAPVQVFSMRPDVRRAAVSENLSFEFAPSAALSYAERFDIRAYDGETLLGWARAKNPGCSVPLPEIGVRKEMPLIHIHISFLDITQSGAAVFSAPCEIELRVAGVDIRRAEMGNDRVLRVTQSAAAPETRAAACLMRGGQTLAILDAGEAEDGVYTLNLQPLAEFSDIALKMAYENDLGRSLWGEAAPLLFDTPEMAAHRFVTDGVEIALKRAAYYAVGESLFYGDSITAPQGDTVCVRFAAQAGGAVVLGPESAFPLRFLGFYTRDARIFYGEHPSDTGEKSFELALDYGDGFESGSLTLGKSGGKYRLTVRVRSAGEGILDSFESMLGAVCVGLGALAKATELRAALSLAPLSPAELLAIRHGYRPDLGFLDIQPGMRLCCETAFYQNIPEFRSPLEEPPDPASERNQSGFVGAGSCVYDVIARDGRITLEPFIEDMLRDNALVIPAPDPVSAEGKQAGGAGVFDMMFQEMQAPFLRVVYPAKIPPRTADNYGSMLCYRHVCLLAGSSRAELDAATANIRANAAPGVPSVACTHQRGRAAITARISVCVNGAPMDCALGSVLGDVLARFGGAGAASVTRVANGREIPVDAPGADCPLLMGDRITLL